jgi:hypothetical protein
VPKYRAFDEKIGCHYGAARDGGTISRRPGGWWLPWFSFTSPSFSGAGRSISTNPSGPGRRGLLQMIV